jgi:GBP family porin
MKHTIVTTVLLGGISQVAFAQSGITIYGLVDAGIEAERGGAAGNVVKISSGIGSAGCRHCLCWNRGF